MPFNVACGHCLNCEEGKSAFCTEVNPGFVSVSELFSIPVYNLTPHCRLEGMGACLSSEALQISYVIAEHTDMSPWARTKAGKPNTCEFPSLTSTHSSYHLEKSTRKTSPFLQISSPLFVNLRPYSLFQLTLARIAGMAWR